MGGEGASKVWFISITCFSYVEGKKSVYLEQSWNNMENNNVPLKAIDIFCLGYSVFLYFLYTVQSPDHRELINLLIFVINPFLFQPILST